MREGSREWAWAQTVWDYLLMRQPLEPCDGVLCLCSHDTRVAEHAASCFLRGMGKWLLFSGGHGTGPHSGRNLHDWTDPEADIFARIAIDMGVPESHIFVENRSANSGENIRFSQALLEEKEQHNCLHFDSCFLLVYAIKPVGERAHLLIFLWLKCFLPALL